MHSEMKSLAEEQTYWRSRLARMSQQLDRKKKYKKNLCDPVPRSKFHLLNKTKEQAKSELLRTGALSFLNPMSKIKQRNGKSIETNKCTSRRNMDDLEDTGDVFMKSLGRYSCSNLEHKNDSLNPFSLTQGNLILIWNIA